MVQGTVDSAVRGVEARDRGLVRGIGSVALAASIVNVVVGAGIFSLPAGMARAAGPYALVAYLLCALAMAGVVFCFAEAGSRVPTSGGTYGYVEAAFGPLAGFVAGVLLWLSCVLACGGIAAAVAGAVARLLPSMAGAGPRAAIILGVILFLMAVNLCGVRPASRFIALTTAVKLVPLVLFVGIGLFFLDPAKLTAGAAPDAGGIGRAVILSLFAFQGMETSLSASGEVAEPARTLPRALIAAMALVAALYVAIQLVAQGLMGASLAASATPLADGMALVDPRLGSLVLIGTAISMAGWIGSDILGAPRVLFAFARDGYLPSALGRVSERTKVPANAIVTHALIAALLALTGTFEQLAVLSVLTACGLYMGGCASAWRLRRRGVAAVGTPLRLPALGFWVVLGMISMALIILAARWVEIAGFIGAVAGSCAIYAATAPRRARLRAAG